ncbi:MAG: hypothetical protein COA33_007995 [Fluviicola sp.]|nr:hypothetical protein [Fluviicola sp.]
MRIIEYACWRMGRNGFVFGKMDVINFISMSIFTYSLGIVNLILISLISPMKLSFLIKNYTFISILTAFFYYAVVCLIVHLFLKKNHYYSKMKLYNSIFNGQSRTILFFKYELIYWLGYFVLWVSAVFFSKPG